MITVIEGTSFLMPAEDVVLTAEFTDGSEEPGPDPDPDPEPGWDDENALAALVNPVVAEV